MLRPSPNHGTLWLLNDDDDDDYINIVSKARLTLMASGGEQHFLKYVAS